MSITCKSLDHIYGYNTPFEYYALKNVNLKIEKGSFTAIIGQTGSGKSTLIQHINALLLPTSGEIKIDDYIISQNNKPQNLKSLRKKSGLVFQFPEYQLFEETIGKDIAFGPKNFGTSEEDASQLVKKILPVVGLDESYLDRSPFDLSGGQKRRVAIAGILVLNPKVLVLDEPTAGLDPKERVKFRNLISSFSQDKIVILSTHIVSDIEFIADEIIVMKAGKKILTGTPEELLQDLRGSVWKCVAYDKKEVEMLNHKYCIINIHQENNTTELRIVSRQKPTVNAVNIEPNLEDLYLAYFQDNEK